MAERLGKLTLRLATEGNKPVLATSLATALAGFQDLVFHLGDLRLGHEPTRGTHRAGVRNNFGLRVTKLTTGSAVLEMEIPAAQAKIGHQIPEAAQVASDVDRLLALISDPTATAEQMAEVIPEPTRRRYVHNSIKRLLPTDKGHYIEVLGGGPLLQLRRAQLSNATRLLIEPQRDGETTVVGRVTKLAVDHTRSLTVDTVEQGSILVHYSSDLEGAALSALGTLASLPIRKEANKFFLTSGGEIEELAALPIDSFQVDDFRRASANPPLQLSVDLEESAGSELYIGVIEEFNVVVAAKNVGNVVKEAKDAMRELWLAYAACPEHELTPRAVQLRHSLMERIAL